MILILSAMKADTIVTGVATRPQPPDCDHNDNYDNWTAKEAEAATMIRLSYSPKVWCIVKGMTKPHKMWNTLETSLDTDGLYLGRQNILHQVRAC